jgi:hypothetical protein
MASSSHGENRMCTAKLTMVRACSLHRVLVFVDEASSPLLTEKEH